MIFFVMAVPLSVIHMYFSREKVAASQFSIYMAVHNFGISFAGFTLAIVQGWGGVPALLLYLLVVSGVSLGILLTVRFPSSRRAETSDSHPAQPSLPERGSAPQVGQLGPQFLG
jgi:PAT family beta-lactamase induction signal transducer AmpG